MRRLALILAAMHALSGQLLAFTNETGVATAQFLRIGVGARALGMGEAYGPVAEGPDALYWNPAGLAQIRGPEVSYSHIEMLRFFHHDHAAIALPVPWLKGIVGFSATFFYQDPLDLVSNTNQIVGKFRPHSEVYTLGYARGFSVGEDYWAEDRRYFQDLWNHPESTMPLDREYDLWTGSLMAGGAVKIIREDIAEASATSLAFDGGVFWRHVELREIALSFVVRNIGTKPRFVNESEDLPSEVAVGGSLDLRFDDHRFLAALEGAAPRHGSPVAKLGLEYSWRIGLDGWAAVRAGYKSLTAINLSPLSGVTGGVGFGYRGFYMDLAFQPMDELGAIYRGSFGYRF